MAMKDIIREKRKELGYTQEQVAIYLGVTTPAVNKWENGMTYPDISLLVPLARLLNIDANTLLCFHENLTDNEINQFCMEVMNTLHKDGFQAGYDLAMTKIEEYPNCTNLLHNIALMLDGAIVMLGITDEAKKKYEQSIILLYERLAQSNDNAIKESAIYMLASKYMNMEEYDKSQAMIDSLPNPNLLDKRLLKAYLCDQLGEYEEAKSIHERILLQHSSSVWNHLLALIELELKQNHIEYASKLALLCSQTAKLLQFSDYYIIIPKLLVSAKKKEEQVCIDMIEQLLHCMKEPFEFANRELYQHMSGMQPKEGQSSSITILPAFIKQLKSDKQFAFLHENEEFRKLLKIYEI